MDNQLEEMSAFFNRRAGTYDEVHTAGIGGGIESKRILASFLPDRTASLLDLGIGTGLELEAIFGRFPEIEVTGLDIAEDMLRQLGIKYPGKHVNLIRASYLEYDLGISRYDAALSVMSLHHYTHPVKESLYRRINRALKENGVYIECDYMLSEQEYENPQEREDFFFSEYARLKYEQGVRDDGVYHYDTPCTVPNQIGMLLRSGFSSVKEVWRVKNTVVLVAQQ